MRCSLLACLPLLQRQAAEFTACAGEAVATDRLFRAAGLQPVPINEQEWRRQGTLKQQQAFVRSLLPAGVLPGAAVAVSSGPGQAPAKAAKAGRVTGVVGRKRLR